MSDSVDQRAEGDEQTLPANHPVSVMKQENAAIQDLTTEMRGELGAIEQLPLHGDPKPHLDTLRTRIQDLKSINVHYQRKEEVLFPYLEQKGVTGPSKVMWAKDDEVRELVNGFEEALASDSGTVGDWKVVSQAVGRPALDAIDEMAYKEEQILFPMAMQQLTGPEWVRISQQSYPFGWCMVPEPPPYQPV